MQQLQYQHENASKYIVDRYMRVTDSEYEQYKRLRNFGYYITTEHDGHDRVLLTVASNRGYLPSIEKFCAYADIAENVLCSVASLYNAVIIQGVQAR